MFLSRDDYVLEPLHLLIAKNATLATLTNEEILLCAMFKMDDTGIEVGKSCRRWLTFL